MLGFHRAAEAGKVGVAHVIDEDDDDIGPVLGKCSRKELRKKVRRVFMS